MKAYSILIFLFCLISCNSETYIKLGKDYRKTILQINIDTIDNYKSLYKTIDSLLCDNYESQIQLLIKDKNDNYKITLVNSCSDDILCFKSKNLLFIKNDSIYKYNIGVYDLDSLSSLIISDFTNNGLNSKLSESPHKFVISIAQPNLLDMKIFKERLLKILHSYIQTKIGLENLKIMLDVNTNYKFESIPYEEDSMYLEMDSLLWEFEKTL
ncbi:hypothetical protein [Flammeovirga pacifica]|uniref:Uncharacterized protein n=1 Tax=Flammeovirga pacifica TaxID=915059 RepID=A0A1S1YWN5_FLAPC|nr:hypothetical protein [Flammeovirga pacifica]OHX65422.1 hypothetical protein NH26_03195 [Flammeovirga pacifica]